MFCVTQAVTYLKIGKNWTKSLNLILHHIGNRKPFIRPCPPPLAQPKYYEHNCNFVNDIIYPNAMFGQYLMVYVLLEICLRGLKIKCHFSIAQRLVLP